MSDIFLAYGSEDREATRVLAKNRVRLCDQPGVKYYQLAEATDLQARALNLLGAVAYL